MADTFSDQDRAEVTYGSFAGEPGTVETIGVRLDKDGKRHYYTFDHVKAGDPDPDPTTELASVEIVHDDGRAVSTTVDADKVYINDTVRAKVTGATSSNFNWINDTAPPRSDHDDRYVITDMEDGEYLLVRVFDAAGVQVAESAPILIEMGTRPGAPSPPPPLPTPPPAPGPGSDPPGPTLQFDAALQPFSPASPWKSKVPGGASFAGASDPRTAALMATGAYINAQAYSIPVFQAKDTDPQRTINSPQGPITIRVPSNATKANGTDGNFTIIDPSHTFVDEFWIYDGASTARRHVRNNIVTGTGMQGGIRAAGFSVLGGLIRKWEIEAGHIDHAVEMTIPSAKARKGYVWPAIGEDGYASQYGGTIPLGTRFAIPPSVDINSLGLSAAGVVLARAMQTYGAYVGDTSAPGTNSNAILCAEPSLEGSAALSSLRSDLRRIKAELRPVT